MKKGLSVLLLSILLCFSISAVSEQHIFDQNARESTYTRFLCNYAGVTGPSSSYPVTTVELKIALNRIARDSLPENLMLVYDNLLKELEPIEDSFIADPSISITPQIFLTDGWSDKESEGGRNSFFLPYNRELPAINGKIQTAFSQHAYLEGEVILKNNALKEGVPLTSFDWLLNYRNNQLNIMGAHETGIVAEMPFLARGSVGNSWMNLIVGRTPHTMGTAFTGNLLINDNFDYQELVKLSFFSNNFTYDISITHFDRQIGHDSFDKTAFSGKQQTRVVHRFDVNLFDKLRVAINFGTLYYCDNAFDFRWFSPFMIAHNYYNYSEFKILEPDDEANNTNSFELELALGKGWTLGAQFILDQFQTFFENKDSLPSSYGLLANISWNGYMGHNILTTWAEFAYINPYLYINDKYDGSISNPNYNYDYLLGYHRRDWAVSSMSPSGYPFGPNSIVCAIGLKGINLKHAIDYQVDLLYWLKGDEFYTLGSNDIKTPYGDLTHTLRLSSSLDWKCNEKLNLFAGVALTQIWITEKQTIRKYTIRPETYLGLSWHVI